ncbi:MAG: hypothetical protein FWD67_08785 [Betaproteobacteria bacterium]|nr:hypothetical protein [Betaproteobacteria bacterium]
MAANTEPLSIKQVLCMAACACLMAAAPARHAGAEECTGSVDLTVDGKAIQGEGAYEGPSRGCGCRGSLTGTANGEVSDIALENGCKKTEVHRDNDEFRSRTTTTNSDGSVNPQGEDTRMVLNREQWRIDKKDGSYGQFGGDWPDDEYTRRIPRPDMSVMFASINKKDNSFTAMFKKGASPDSDIARMKTYVERLKERGFTIDARPYENSRYGIYAYRAKDGTGYSVQANCGKSGCSIGLSKREH